MSLRRPHRPAPETPPPKGIPGAERRAVVAADLTFPFAGRDRSASDVVRVLGGYLSERRKERIEQVLLERTYGIVPVLEGVVDTGNISAVLRTAEGVGCQAFHLITAGRTFKNSVRTAVGAQKWTDLFRWEQSETCAAYLKEQGYRLVATHPSAARPFHEIDFTVKTALLLGNERDGLSEALLAAADERCTIPMCGFTSSFNISVAAGILLHHAREDRIARQGFHGDLSERERANLRALWYLRSVRRSRDLAERAFSAEMG